MDMQGGESQHGTMQGGQFYPDQDAQLVQQIQEAMQRGPDPTRAIRSQQMRQGDPNGVERAIEAFLNALAASYGARPPRVPTEIDDGAADHAAAYRPLHDMEPLANAGPGGEAPANPARAAFAMTPLVRRRAAGSPACRFVGRTPPRARSC